MYRLISTERSLDIRNYIENCTFVFVLRNKHVLAISCTRWWLLVCIWYFPRPLLTRAFTDTPLLAWGDSECPFIPPLLKYVRRKEYLNPSLYSVCSLKHHWVQLKWRIRTLDCNNLRVHYSNLKPADCLLLLKRKIVTSIGGQERTFIWVNTGHLATSGE